MKREGGGWVRREGGGERGVASESGRVAERTRGGREGERGWLMPNIMSTLPRFLSKTDKLERNAYVYTLNEENATQ